MFDPRSYREACRELRAPEDKIKEVIAMTENKKIRRPLRTALFCAAAIAMMVLGVSAANPEMVKEFGGRIAEIINVNPYKMEMITEDRSKITVFSAPQAAVENRDGRAILVIDGEDIGDITDELNAEGRYRYEDVIGESHLNVTVEGTAEEWTATVTVGEPDGPVSYSYNYMDNGFFSGPAAFTETVDGTDVYVSISEYDGETGEPVPEN